jgi:hypothetical protein
MTIKKNRCQRAAVMHRRWLENCMIHYHSCAAVPYWVYMFVIPAGVFTASNNLLFFFVDRALVVPPQILQGVRFFRTNQACWESNRTCQPDPGRGVKHQSVEWERGCRVSGNSRYLRIEIPDQRLFQVDDSAANRTSRWWLVFRAHSYVYSGHVGLNNEVINCPLAYQIHSHSLCRLPWREPQDAYRFDSLQTQTPLWSGDMSAKTVTCAYTSSILPFYSFLHPLGPIQLGVTFS